jgi:hypothetical protein
VVEPHIAAVKAKARDALAQALGCSESGADEEENLKAHIRQVLSDAAHNGQLVKALDNNTRKKTHVLEDLKASFRKNLVNGARDSRLEAALKKVKAGPTSPQYCKTQDEDLKQHVCNQLVTGSRNGQLAAALSKIKRVRDSEKSVKKESPPDLRIAWRTTLAEAARDGRLEQSLQRVLADKELQRQQHQQKLAEALEYSRSTADAVNAKARARAGLLEWASAGTTDATRESHPDSKANARTALLKWAATPSTFP